MDFLLQGLLAPTDFDIRSEKPVSNLLAHGPFPQQLDFPTSLPLEHS
jgi:hypothetical protein